MPSDSVLHDIVFKMVFGERGREPLLKALLNSLLQLAGPDRIIEVAILNPISERRFFSEKGTILDLHCQDEKGSHYVVEVQVQGADDHIERTLYYTACQLRSQLNPGEPYGNLERLVVLSIVDFTLFPKHKDSHSRCVFYDVAHNHELTDRVEVHFLELKKFKGNQPDRLQTSFERWLHFLKFSQLYARENTAIPEVLKVEEGIEMAIKTMRETLASEECQELIRARDMAEHDAASRLLAAKKEANQVVARKMLASGLGLEQISEFTGLSLEQIRDLQTHPRPGQDGPPEDGSGCC